MKSRGQRALKVQLPDATLLWAVTVATIVPILADKINIDPAVISGPMISTVVDATGLLIYFSLAKVMLNL